MWNRSHSFCPGNGQIFWTGMYESAPLIALVLGEKTYDAILRGSSSYRICLASNVYTRIDDI